MASGIQVEKRSEEAERVLTPAALKFVEDLQRRFNPRREELLRERARRERELQSGKPYRFLTETESVRRADWRVAPTPDDLQKRWVEITGPAERKMIINALNSGASVFMADFEDALSPSWSNIVQGQANLIDAVRRKLTYTSPEGKEYRLNPTLATLLVRPRGWHLVERHVTVDGAPVSGSLFDFALYFFHNAKELISRKTGPYFYLPKIESHLEARLWNDVFVAAQESFGIPKGTIRATVLVETLPAAFEMEEILYELREHASGLNAGRWDYIFSLIKKLRHQRDLSLPDRVQVTMTVPFMRAYTELLVRTCHQRGAHALGGMAPFIPSRKNPEINAAALAKSRDDKVREANDGFDGTWVAHPDLVPVAMEVFQEKLGPNPHQKQRLREDVQVKAEQLLDIYVPGGTITEGGVRNNISVALQYLDSWLQGIGAVGIFNLMEDAATCEISRAQLWLWIHRGARLEDGRQMTQQLYSKLRDEEIDKLGGRGKGKLRQAAELIDSLVLKADFEEFLTLPAYQLLD